MGDSIDAPTCGTGGTDCNAIELAYGATLGCERACVQSCEEFYTDAPSGDVPSTGHHIYDNSDCECEGGESTVYYSNKCGQRLVYVLLLGKQIVR